MTETPDGLDPRWDRDAVRPIQPKIASAAHSGGGAGSVVLVNLASLALLIVILPFWAIALVLVQCLFAPWSAPVQAVWHWKPVHFR